MATAKTTPKTVADRKAEAATAVFIVVSPLDFDKVRYEIGDEVELTEGQALALIGHTVKTKTKEAA